MCVTFFPLSRPLTACGRKAFLQCIPGYSRTLTWPTKPKKCYLILNGHKFEPQESGQNSNGSPSTSCHSINSSSATHFRCFAVTFQTGHGLKAAGLIWLMLMWLHVPSCPPSPRSAALTKPQTSVPLVGMCATHEKHTEILKWDPPLILQNSTPSGIPVLPTGRLPIDTINFNQQFQEQPHTFNLGPNILCSQATHLGRARDS